MRRPNPAEKVFLIPVGLYTNRQETAFPGKDYRDAPMRVKKNSTIGMAWRQLNPPRGKPRGGFTVRIKKAIFSSLAFPAASGGECERCRGSDNYIHANHLGK
jgi:hypothetical protein